MFFSKQKDTVNTQCTGRDCVYHTMVSPYTEGCSDYCSLGIEEVLHSKGRLRLGRCIKSNGSGCTDYAIGYTISNTHLQGEYAGNAFRANEKYCGHGIRITGQIQRIDISTDGIPYVTIVNKFVFPTQRTTACFFQDVGTRELLSFISIGMNVLIVGTVVNCNQYIIVLRDCMLLSFTEPDSLQALCYYTHGPRDTEITSMVSLERDRNTGLLMLVMTIVFIIAAIWWWCWLRATIS